MKNIKWRMYILSVWNIGPIYIQICSLPLSIETISLIRLLEYDSHVQPLCQSVVKSGIWLSARIWKPGSTVASGFWIARYSTDGICLSRLSRNYGKDGELTRLKYGVENLISTGLPEAGGYKCLGSVYTRATEAPRNDIHICAWLGMWRVTKKKLCLVLSGPSIQLSAGN